jgi:uncharacterized protein
VTAVVHVFRCGRCRHEVFPARLLCPRCGSSEWESSEAPRGLVEDSTVVRRAPGTPSVEPVHIGSVRVGDVVIVARLLGEAAPGTPVQLEYRDGVPVAHPTE